MEDLPLSVRRKLLGEGSNLLTLPGAAILRFHRSGEPRPRDMAAYRNSFYLGSKCELLQKNPNVEKVVTT